jgi:short subunit dehydrogenase-like uncharacterized protein
MGWAIYGATGFTGGLIAAEAVRRGERPLLVGRSEERLRAVAEPLRLEWSTRPLGDVDLVVNAAGPFRATVAPVLKACIAVGAHYLDISNELPQVQHVFAQDSLLRRAEIAAIPAAGFGTVATDAAAVAALAALPGATRLEVCMFGDNVSGGPGTASSVVDVLAQGGVRLADGSVRRTVLGAGTMRARTPRGSRSMVPVATGDILTAQRTTGIADISAYFPFSAPVGALRLGLPVLSALARARILRALPEGPSRPAHSYRSSAWARATAGDSQVTAWLETGEGYAFTAVAVVEAVLATLAGTPAGAPAGATTVAAAFGGDFALRVPSTTIRLLDAPPEP